MINALEIKKLHDQYLSDNTWPDSFKLQYQKSNSVHEFIEANHYFNTKLWNEEDLARRKKVPDTEIASNKRAIDKFNQARNDCIEKIDDFFLKTIPKLSERSGKQNSETLGAIVDRLSILSLKIYHMSLQTKRTDVPITHLDSCIEKFKILVGQRKDLLTCFDDLVNDCVNGHRYFKQYKQYKMYNDPKLNPQMYNEK